MAAAASKNKEIPHDDSAERAFLGALLIEPRVIDEAVAMVRDADFFNQRHAIIYGAILELHSQRVAVDTVTLATHLKKEGSYTQCGGTDYINQLLDATPTAANLSHYGKIIRDKSILRSLIQTAGEIADMAFDSSKEIEEIANDAEHRLFEITDRNITQSYEKIQNVIHRSFEILKKYKSQGFSGITTGFAGFDKLTAGLQPGQLIVIAGRPGSGKTAFCLNMATKVAMKTERPVLFFSLEMGKEELVLRMLCSEAGLDNSKIRSGMFSQADMTNKLIPAADKLFATRIVIDDQSPINIMEAMAKARRIKNEMGDLAMVIFDYMQIASGPPGVPSDNRYLIISEISRSLKYLSKELQVPVVALSQLSREIEKRTNRRPVLSDLRESGQIEQDADIVAFIDRPYQYTKNEEDKNLAELIIEKHRNGPVGSVPLVFFGEYMRFEDRTDRKPE